MALNVAHTDVVIMFPFMFTVLIRCKCYAVVASPDSSHASVVSSVVAEGPVKYSGLALSHAESRPYCESNHVAKQ